MRHRWLPVLALGAVLVGGTVALAAHVPQVDPATVPPGPALGSAFLVAHNSIGQFPVWPIAQAVKPDGADVFVQHVRLGANAPTAWHTHPGPAIVTVVGGALTYEDARKNQCRQSTYSAGQGFVDQGSGHVHRAIAGPAGADFYVVYILPPGSATHVTPTDPSPGCAS
jgi:quercetin dioxygenase-like cupin family protein